MSASRKRIEVGSGRWELGHRKIRTELMLFLQKFSQKILLIISWFRSRIAASMQQQVLDRCERQKLEAAMSL